MKERLQTLAAAVALLAAGFLLGSLWLQWRSADGGGEGAGSSSPAYDLGSRPRVEVLNGMGAPGAAERAARRLRGMGFDVVYFGNADHYGYDRTLVLARSGDVEAAHDVADSLGVEEVERRPEPSLYLDGTVILGADWDSLVAVRDSVAATADPEPWWKVAWGAVRGLLGRLTGR